MIPPFLDETVEERESPDSYPDLSRALLLLDRISSIRYPDADIGTVLAHQACSIPLRTGAKALIELSQRLIINS